MQSKLLFALLLVALTICVLTPTQVSGNVIKYEYKKHNTVCRYAKVKNCFQCCKDNWLDEWPDQNKKRCICRSTERAF